MEVVDYLSKKSIGIVEEDGSSNQRVVTILRPAVDRISSLMINNFKII